jgi:hypothetical protein
MVAHTTLLEGPAFLDGTAARRGPLAARAPAILRLVEPDFIPHLLSRLESDPQGLAGARAAAPLRLDQPVHRAFNTVLVEAFCAVPGMPRLEGAKIVSAGLVVRRRRGGRVQGWLKAGDRVLGWHDLPAEAVEAASGWEPDAALRAAQKGGRNRRLHPDLGTLPGTLDGLGEAAEPLFQAPPAIATRTGATLLYGYLPVTSAERPTADGANPPAAPFGEADVAKRVPRLLRADRDPALPVPTGVLVSRNDIRPAVLPEPEAGGLRLLTEALTWLAQETALFEGGAASQGLAAELGKLTVTRDGGKTSTNLRALFTEAYDALIGEPQGAVSFRLPDAWPRIESATFQAIVKAATTAMLARWDAASPTETRFERTGARYLVRCFLRVQEHADCPPRLVWSPESPPFAIKAWHESGAAPPTPIELPAPGGLRGLAPNVAFKVPPELQKFMDRMNLDDLLDGKRREGGLDFGMICSFSIPILTLCAFIVLQLFLVLLNIVFFWLPFIRICLPFPKPADGDGES